MRTLPSLLRPALLRSLIPAIGALVALADTADAQLLFDWPVRAEPGPEALLTGAPAPLWNPAGIAAGAGATNDAWLVHMDGPDATGIRGLAAAVSLDLPFDARGAVAYQHLSIADITRTSTSPEPDPGRITVSEDVAWISLARDLSSYGGIGAGVRYQRATAGTEIRSAATGEIGLLLRPTLPLQPRFGLSMVGIGDEPKLLGGAEVALPRGEIETLQLHAAYGFKLDLDPAELEHRLALTGTWRELLRFGAGVTGQQGGNGWTPLWLIGVEVGRYSFAVLREGLANDFGAAHFYRASVSF